jgi:two-component sensor histidine kinase
MLSNAQSDSLDPGQLADKVIHAALSSAPIQCPVAMDAAPELPRVSSKQAVTLALVLNELTTNSVKYAFVDRAAGQIGVRIEHAAGENGAPRVRLVYRDDGPGWPDAVLDGERDSTGLWLIEASVTHNLGGEIAWYNDGGAVAEIQFPVRASGALCSG